MKKTMPSYLFSLVRGVSDVAQPNLTGDMPLNHRMFMAQFKAISQVAANGACVIVGRCADYVLKEQPNMLSVFMYADLAARIERTMKKQNIERGEAKELVHKRDKQRQGYYNFFADGNWGHRSNYHLMFNTTGLTPEAAADAMIAFIRNKTA